MNIIVAIVLLVVGIVLLAFGIGSTNSIQNSFSSFFTGHFTDHTMWLIVGGTICTALGVIGCYLGTRDRRHA